MDNDKQHPVLKQPKISIDRAPGTANVSIFVQAESVTVRIDRIRKGQKRWKPTTIVTGWSPIWIPAFQEHPAPESLDEIRAWVFTEKASYRLGIVEGTVKQIVQQANEMLSDLSAWELMHDKFTPKTPELKYQGTIYEALYLPAYEVVGRVRNE